MRMKKNKLVFSIDQIGIVVKDIHKAINFYSSNFGIGPFHEYETFVPDLIVRGQVSPSKTKFAFAQVGKIQLELIQNIEGDNIYSEFLQNKGEGLHHIAMCVDDVEKEVAKWEKNGVSVLQKGRASGVNWAYMDTESIGGVIIEIIPKRH